MNWDDWDASRVDDEITRQTDFAKSFAKASANAAVKAGVIPDYAYAEGGAVIRFRVPGRYVMEVRGQSSATGHGKQGSHPTRIAFLRELYADKGEPVYVVFVDEENADPAKQKWQAVWLGREFGEPDIAEIDKTILHRRQGWEVKDMIRGEGLIDFPADGPARVQRAQEALL